MELLVNGERRPVADGATVAQLLDVLGLPRERVAVEVNLDIVPRAEHASRRLSPGDRVEVVSFVGGG